jgi:acyl dehydratase
VHGEQRVKVFKALPAAATLIAHNQVISLSDKGLGKGAIAHVQRNIYEQRSGDLLAQATQVTFLRGDGGFSQDSGVSDPLPESLPAVPDREPDLEAQAASLPQAALIYRLSGDYNPLHADPKAAREAGFARPILHGLGTFGMAAHAVLKLCCEYDGTRMKAMSARFTAPVYPGETIRFQLWRAHHAGFQLRARVDSRNAVVLDNGHVELFAS